MIYLHLPHSPRVIPRLQVKVIRNMQRVEHPHELPGVPIIGLILRGCPKIDMELPGSLSARKDLNGAVLMQVGFILAPDDPLSAVVTSQRDDGAKDVRMMDRDIHCSEATHRKSTNPAVSSIGKRAIVLIKDRKSTRLNSSHDQISYAVFCLKKKKTDDESHFLLSGTRCGKVDNLLLLDVPRPRKRGSLRRSLDGHTYMARNRATGAAEPHNR